MCSHDISNQTWYFSWMNKFGSVVISGTDGNGHEWRFWSIRLPFSKAPCDCTYISCPSLAIFTWLTQGKIEIAHGSIRQQVPIFPAPLTGTKREGVAGRLTLPPAIDPVRRHLGDGLPVTSLGCVFRFEPEASRVEGMGTSSPSRTSCIRHSGWVYELILVIFTRSRLYKVISVQCWLYTTLKFWWKLLIEASMDNGRLN